MDNFITILTIIDVMIALLLISVILVQQSKDGGFGGSPFGGAGESVFGGQAADHLTKFTIILTALFFVVTLTLAIVTGRRPGGDMSLAEDNAAVTEMTAPADENKKEGKTDMEELEKLAGEKEDKAKKDTLKPDKTPETAVPEVEKK